MHTAICDRLGIEYPIFAFSHCRDVVAAVTNAGGLGVLGATGHSLSELEIDLSWIDDQVSGKPYGVDLLLPGNIVEPGAERAAALFPPQHVAFVDDVLVRYHVPPLPAGVPARSGAISVSPDAAAQQLDVAFAHPIKLVASALGPPPATLIERAHRADVLVAALVGNREHARRQQAAGVDLIVAQGTEAGGHTGTISTMVLVPEVVEQVAPTPVLAAGGIMTGAQVAAALALGAEGVWCGSVWLTTPESEIDPVVRQKLLEAESGDTVRSRSLTGKPARMLRTAWTEEWDSSDAPGTLPMPLQTMLTAPAVQRINRASDKEAGARELATYFVGQGIGLVTKIRTARQVVEDMVGEYVEVAERFARQLDG